MALGLGMVAAARVQTFTLRQRDAQSLGSKPAERDTAGRAAVPDRGPRVCEGWHCVCIRVHSVCVRVCVCLYVRRLSMGVTVCARVCTCPRVGERVRVCVCVPVCGCLCACVSMCPRVWVCVRTRVRVSTCRCVHVGIRTRASCLCVRVCVCRTLMVVGAATGAVSVASVYKEHRDFQRLGGGGDSAAAAAAPAGESIAYSGGVSFEWMFLFLILIKGHTLPR